MKLSRDELRARLLTRAETVIDDILDWDMQQGRLPLVHIEDHTLPAWQQLGEQTAQLLWDQREGHEVANNTPWDSAAQVADPDAEVEITDLPQRFDSSGLEIVSSALSGFFSPRGRKWRYASIACVAVVAFLVVFGSLSSFQLSSLCIVPPSTTKTVASTTNGNASTQLQLNNPPTPTPAETWITGDGRTFNDNGRRGFAPQDCPEQATVGNINAAPFSTAIGGAPLWISGLKGPQATLTRPTKYLPSYGWSYAVTLAVRTDGYRGPIVLQAMSQADNSQLWFDNIAGKHSSGPAIISDLTIIDGGVQPRPEYQSGPWQIWTTNLYVPASGCYFFDAAWNGGGWQGSFSAGQ